MARPIVAGRGRAAGSASLAEDPGPVPAAAVRSFLHDLVHGMRCGVLSAGADGRLLLLNEPGRQILELDAAPPEGVPVERALGRHPALVQVLREAFDMSSLPNRAELDLRWPDDRSKRVGFTLSMLRHGSEPPYAVALFFKDLTQVEHKEEQERLKDRLAALGQMAANLAHEMRNPLASIKVSCSLLRRRLAGDDETLALLDKIKAEVVRLNGTITSCLDFVRPLAPSFAEARLTPVIEEALEAARTRRGAPGITIERGLDPSLPPLLIDRGQIRQVFENLFVNAMEAMGSSGKLIVESSVVPAPVGSSVPYRPAGAHADPWQSFDSYAQVRVADTGPGISEQLRDRLFYPFFTTKQHGSGVGLSLSKKIVSGHRGMLDVESHPGEGAVFTVRLPLVTNGTSEG